MKILLTLFSLLLLVGEAYAQQTPTQTIIRDGTGDTTQQNVTNGNSHVNVGRINDVAPSMGAGNTGTGVQRVIEATDSQLSSGVGATSDAAASAGGTGSINAKLRLLTDLVNQVLTELGQKTEPSNTQAISAASLPLPTGAATAANQDGVIKDGTGDTTQANVVGGRLQVENYNANLAADNSTNATNKVPILPCTATASAPSWTEGRQVPCSTDLSGNHRSNIGAINGVAPSMGAGNTGTGVQRVIEATDSQLSAGVGATGDAAATAGGTGSMNAKQRLMTSQLDSIKTAVETIDNIVSGSGANISQMGGAAVSMGNGASGTGVQRVTIANDSTGVLATVNSLTQMNGQTIAMGTGTRSAGTQRVTVATDDVVPASQSGTWTVQPGNTANTTPWLTSSIPATSGGTSVCYITSAASTNSTNCKASAGQLYGFDLVNTTATVYYLRLYNSSSAPTCSSATGFVRTIPIPASTTGAGIARSIPVGEAYGTGIGFCLTGGGSSTDNTNAATGVYVTLNYK